MKTKRMKRSKVPLKNSDTTGKKSTPKRMQLSTKLKEVACVVVPLYLIIHALRVSRLAFAQSSKANKPPEAYVVEPPSKLEQYVFAQTNPAVVFFARKSMIYLIALTIGNHLSIQVTF